jgi:hypothetical protein
MKFLTHPGRAKKRLWAVCLHEAAHALAAAFFLNVASTAKVFRKGGICHPLRSSSAGPAAHAVFLIVGDMGAALAQFPDCNQIPAGRPHFGRWRFRRRLRRHANDAKLVANIMESNGPLKDSDIAELCRETWGQIAMNFVTCRRKMIVEIATKLYLTGTVFVPAKDKDADWAMDFALGR